MCNPIEHELPDKCYTTKEQRTFKKKKRHKADDHITNTVKEINRW